MAEVDEIFSNLRLIENGIWRPREIESLQVSYPEGDHDACFAIEDASPWFSHRNKVIGEIAKKTFQFRDVLDVGGGNGAVSAYLASIGFRSILLEPGQQGVRNAIRRGLKDVIWAQLNDLAPASISKKLEVEVGLFDVVEHIEDDVAFLKLVADKLSAKSSVAVTVPAYSLLWSQRDVEAGHYRRYTLQGLKEVFHKAGFEVVYGSYFFVLLAPLMFVVYSVQRLLSKPTTPEKKAQGRDETHQLQRESTGRLQHKILGVLHFVFWVERLLLKLVPLPFGASIIVVARKKSHSD